MTDAIKICGLGIIFALICTLVKNYQSGFIVPTRIAGILIIFGVLLVFITPLFQYLEMIMQKSLPIEYIEMMTKAMAIAYVTQISSDICRDCGENNIAAGIDTLAKIEILIIALPPIKKAIDLSEELALW